MRPRAATRAADTLKRWDSVVRGEKQHIFPFQENADAIFNSALVHELAVLRPFAEPLLLQVRPTRPSSSSRTGCCRSSVVQARAARDVPDNSILREFVGGSILENFRLWPLEDLDVHEPGRLSSDLFQPPGGAVVCNARRILFFFAHPDDEAFLAGGVACHTPSRAWTRAGDGDTRGIGQGGDPPVCAREELPAVREAELRVAARLLGMGRCCSATGTVNWPWLPADIRRGWSR